MTWQPSVKTCDEYLDQRTGCYQYRTERYSAAASKMYPLLDSDTVFDIGAGMTEFDYYLRVSCGWKGRYCPIDGGIDSTNIDDWTPPRDAEWFVLLEILEHLYKPAMLLEKIKQYATKGIVLSTPNSRTTDVLGMDHTHVTIIEFDMLKDLGFTVQERSFYGSPCDSLFAWMLM